MAAEGLPVAGSSAGRDAGPGEAFWAQIKWTVADTILEDPTLLRRIGEAVKDGDEPANGKTCWGGSSRVTRLDAGQR